MSRWLQMAEQDEQTKEALPANRLEPAESPKSERCRDLLPVSTGLPVSSSEEAGAAKEPSAPPDKSTFKHGQSLSGRPLTWTGKIVSLAEWRALSPWERNGPDGRIWCERRKRWHAHRGYSDV